MSASQRMHRGPKALDDDDEHDRDEDVEEDPLCLCELREPDNDHDTHHLADCGDIDAACALLGSCSPAARPALAAALRRRCALPWPGGAVRLNPTTGGVGCAAALVFCCSGPTTASAGLGLAALALHRWRRRSDAEAALSRRASGHASGRSSLEAGGGEPPLSSASSADHGGGTSSAAALPRPGGVR